MEFRTDILQNRQTLYIEIKASNDHFQNPLIKNKKNNLTHQI